MIRNIQDNIGFGTLKIANQDTKNKLIKTMNNSLECKTAVAIGLNMLDKASGSDIVYLKGRDCKDSYGYKLQVSTDAGSKLTDEVYIASQSTIVDILSAFNIMTTAICQSGHDRVENFIGGFQSSDTAEQVLDFYM